MKRVFNKFLLILYWLLNYFQFAKLGFGSYFKNPVLITKKYIYCGNNVIALYGGIRIQGVKSNENEPTIVLENGVSFQQNLHLTCGNYISIGKDTAIAANVTITDIHHPFEDITLPIEQQKIKIFEVIIGHSCKVYNNAVILPNVHIGCHVTIGANSVVTHDIPDYCVAVGAPARIVKRYNFETSCWQKTNPDGSFII